MSNEYVDVDKLQNIEKIKKQIKEYENLLKKNDKKVDYADLKSRDEKQFNLILNDYKKKFKVNEIESLLQTEYKSYVPVFVYGMGFTRTELANFFHAVCVVKCERQRNVGKKIVKDYKYLLISHYAQGENIITVFDNFPYINYRNLYGFDLNGKKNWFIYATYNGEFDKNNTEIYGNDTFGAIICKARVKPDVTIKMICEQVLVWWHMNDNRTSNTIYPGSCTGLTETILYIVSDQEDYKNCISMLLTKYGKKVLKNKKFEPYPI